MYKTMLQFEWCKVPITQFILLIRLIKHPWFQTFGVNLNWFPNDTPSSELIDSRLVELSPDSNDSPGFVKTICGLDVLDLRSSVPGWERVRHRVGLTSLLTHYRRR